MSEPNTPQEPTTLPQSLEPPASVDAELEMKRRSRRSFCWAAASLLAGYGGWKWLVTRRTDDGVLWPLRRVLEINEQLSRDYFRKERLAPTFASSIAQEPRPNGDIGLGDGFELATWKLTVEGVAGREEPLSLSLEAIQKLPRTEITTELKCIEGWSTVVHWAGVRLADFMAKYPPTTQSGNPPDIQNNPEDLVRYISMETPDQGYYIGLEMASGLHPQTLLCYEMNGAPLTMEHGAPLRLVVPVKYGIKHIKRLGTIRYTDQRPSDYWAEQGYDWYAGH